MKLLDPPHVAADNRGLLLGDGLFETLRLYGGRPFRLERHLERLAVGAERLGIQVPPDLQVRVDVALARWGREDGALRVTLTRGGGGGMVPPDPSEPSLLISISPIPDFRPPGAGDTMIGLAARTFGRIDERSLTSGLKLIGYGERIHALRLAREQGADEALLRNSGGRIVEASAANLVGVRDGQVLSPGVAHGALPGITREVILEVAKLRGMSVVEKGFDAADLQTLDELFATSSIRELAPIVSVDGLPVGSGAPGPETRAFAREFRRVTAEEGGRLDQPDGP